MDAKLSQRETAARMAAWFCAHPKMIWALLSFLLLVRLGLFNRQQRD
jgi:hypothetical protein